MPTPMQHPVITGPLAAQRRFPLAAPDAARPLPWLAAVAAAFTLVQLLLVVPGSGLGWDETVYVSQVSRDIPAAFFSAPRARGVSYLVAPVAAFTTSTTALRVYLALCSGTGLFLALWVWRAIVPVRVLAAAGALFASLWITLYYGPEAMPNIWCALGALAAVGCFLRVVRDRDDRNALTGLVAGTVLVALMRPGDAFYLVLPLGIAVLAVPGWRRPAARRVLAVLVGAVVIGTAPWIVEAYQNYGGLSARLHRAGEIQGGMDWQIAVDDQVRALDGRILCRPCEVPWKYPVNAVWWFLLPLATAGGLIAASRAGRRAPAVLATVVAGSMAVPYLFQIGYGAPRFLLPTYALLALPVAECLRGLVLAVRPARRPAVAAVLGIVLAAHLVVQFIVLHRLAESSRASHKGYTAIADRLHRLGVRGPCIVTGSHAPPVGYYAGCASRQPTGHDTSITVAGLLQAARHETVAVIVLADETPPPYARTWQREPLPRLHGKPQFFVHLSPPPVRSTAPAAASGRAGQHGAPGRHSTG